MSTAKDRLPIGVPALLRVEQVPNAARTRFLLRCLAMANHANTATTTWKRRRATPKIAVCFVVLAVGLCFLFSFSPQLHLFSFAFVIYLVYGVVYFLDC